MDSESLLAPLREVSRRAGSAILGVYATDFAVRSKADRSPVTDADVRAEAIIIEALQQLTPQIPIVAEEAASESAVPAVGERFWLVDPLDGTREFVRRNGEFTVNIALVERGRPVLGLIYAPALDQLYFASAGGGAYIEQGGQRRAIACRTPPARGLSVVTSRWHSDPQPWDPFLNGRKLASQQMTGSSLKFGLVACGQADLYPRMGRTWEWDTAAGQAIVTAAGGSVTDCHGIELRYGKPNFLNPSFIARGPGG